MVMSDKRIIQIVSSHISMKTWSEIQEDKENYYDITNCVIGFEDEERLDKLEKLIPTIRKELDER